MKKLIICISATLLLLACSNRNKNSVALFNDISFKISEGEKVIGIDSNKKDTYEYYLGSSTIQAPLFRCIKAAEYTIYLGIPINTTIRELSEHKLSYNRDSIIFECDSTDYLYLRFKKNGNNVVVFSKDFNKNLIYSMIVLKSNELCDSLFTKEKIICRFNK